MPRDLCPSGEVMQQPDRVRLQKGRSLRSADDAKFTECFLITKGEKGTLLLFK